MVIYKPVTDKAELKKLFPDRQFVDDMLYCGYFAYENDDLTGNCIVMTDKIKCWLSDITAKDGDRLCAEGLIRSALNFAANRGAFTAFCKEDNFADVLEKLGFEKTDGLYCGEIPTLLMGECCKNKPKC